MGKNMNRILFGIFFLSTLVSADWYNASWLYRKQITVDHTQVAGDLSNFPVLINDGADSDFLAHAKADGSDFVITESDGTTKLKREIEEYDSTDGSLVLWFKAPSLLAAIDTTYYVYYGNAAASEVNDADTWDANYIGVWHLMEDGATTRYDATVNDNDGIPSGGSAVVGQIANADDLTGNAYIDITAAINEFNSDTYTIEMWTYIHDNTLLHFYSMRDADLIESWANYGEAGVYFRYGDWGAKLKWTYRFSEDVWGSVVWVGNSSTGRYIYHNGELVASGSGSWTAATQSGNFYLGKLDGLPFYFDGIIDEVRISDIARDSSWIATEYNNQYTPATFLTLGSEESPAPAGGAKWRGYYDGKNLQIRRTQ